MGPLMWHPDSNTDFTSRQPNLVSYTWSGEAWHSDVLRAISHTKAVVPDLQSWVKKSWVQST